MPPTTAAEDLRRFTRWRAFTVVVVTVSGAAGAVGFTATSFTSVSLCLPVLSSLPGAGVVELAG